MTPLAALLRSARPADPADDGMLLDRLRSAAAPDAFAELVRRHGRLVWAVCRHQTRSEADADDCFQAVWLALLRRPGAVRQPVKLSAFLHAVAVRVCRKLRAANDRRVTRERAVAVSDGRAIVPDSAWDRALAAVHEEVAALPEPLRVAFVRCGLEGQGVTAAAEELGWKLGTLSGRLTRAKELLAKRLDARGLTAGTVAATVCGGAVPAAVAGRTAELVAGTVPASILTLSQGVVVMNRVKLLAATLILTCGLGAGVGGRWLAGAGAQDKPVPPATAVRQEGVAPLLETNQPPPAPGKREGYQYGRDTGSRWDYLYLFPDTTKPSMTADDFLQTVERREASGWTFVGSAPIAPDSLYGVAPVPQPPPATPALVFRRPLEPAGAATAIEGNHRVQSGTLTINSSGETALTLFNPVATNTSPDPHRRIADLEKQLAEAKVNLAASKTPRVVKRIEAAELRDHPSHLIGVAVQALPQRFGADWGQRLKIEVTEKGVLVLTGDAEAVNYAAGVFAAVGAK